MSSFKVSFIFAILAFGVPAFEAADSASEFWLNFAELLTEDVLTQLGNVQLSSASIPNVPIPFPAAPAAPSVPAAPSAPVAPAQQADIMAYYQYLLNMHAAKPTTAKPEDCDQEKVKIIVINDCDDKKDDSSESCEHSSEEAGIIVPVDPYERRGRYSYKNVNSY